MCPGAVTCPAGAVRTGTSPQARTAARAFGPRAASRASSSVVSRSPARPAAPAARSQDRNPLAVVTSTSSGGFASTRLVVSTSASSSSTGCSCMVGACSTVAPRQVSVSTRSVAPGCAVTTTVQPLSGPGPSTAHTS